MGDSMNYLVRKPDAGKPHVRFDERGVETASTASYSGTSNRKGWSPLRLRLNFTAPLLDSTNPRMPRNPEGVSSLGQLWASFLSYSPVWGCSFVTPPISAPNSPRVTCEGISTVSWRANSHFL